MSYEKEVNRASVASYAVNYGNLDAKEMNNKTITCYITSGSVLCVKNAIRLGGFDENLFIDQVDSEFAYKAEEYGYKIEIFFDIPLNHCLGEPTYYRIGNYSFVVLNHNALRKYYIIRNTIYVMKKYSFLKKAYTWYIIKTILKTIIFEKNKIEKVKYICQAIKDAKQGCYGKRR